jgi:hypothetical protein
MEHDVESITIARPEWSGTALFAEIGSKKS